MSGASLVVNNPSFEAQSFAEGGYSGAITDWEATGGFAANPSPVANEFGATEVINGSANYGGFEGAGSNIRQALTTDGSTAYTITSTDVFTVSLDIGRRGRSQENNPAILGIEIVSADNPALVFARSVLDVQGAVNDGSNTNTGTAWAVNNGQWLVLDGNQSPAASNTFELTSTGLGAGVGDQAMLRFILDPGSAGQVAVDNVSVSVDPIPEPSSALLGGLGLLTLVVRRRR